MRFLGVQMVNAQVLTALEYKERGGSINRPHEDTEIGYCVEGMIGGDLFASSEEFEKYFMDCGEDVRSASLDFLHQFKSVDLCEGSTATMGNTLSGHVLSTASSHECRELRISRNEIHLCEKIEDIFRVLFAWALNGIN